MSNLPFLRKVLKMADIRDMVGQSQHGSEQDCSFDQSDQGEDAIEFGDVEEIYLNKLVLDNQGDRLEVDSLTESETREFDIDFIESHSNTNLNSTKRMSDQYCNNAMKFYRDIVDLDPLYGRDPTLDNSYRGDHRMAALTAGEAGARNCVGSCEVCVHRSCSLDRVSVLETNTMSREPMAMSGSHSVVSGPSPSEVEFMGVDLS